ncbi:MAG: KOW domain-containing RNA-binding protein [Ruminococcus sp.]|nr:KOW domain-containing RNA-binding protein [Ruminococcus sp.]
MSGFADIRAGSVVKALAGREKGRTFVAVAADGGFVYIADGKERKLERPKRKNPKHISPIGAEIDTKDLTNKKLRRLLSSLPTQGDETAVHRFNDE